MFSAGPRGTAVTGPGPELGPHPILLQHLVQSLNAICGRHYREGERLPNPGVLTPIGPRIAEATGPQPQWLTDGVTSRVSDDIRATVVPSPEGPLNNTPQLVCRRDMLR